MSTHDCNPRPFGLVAADELRHEPDTCHYARMRRERGYDDYPLASLRTAVATHRCYDAQILVGRRVSMAVQSFHEGREVDSADIYADTRYDETLMMAWPAILEEIRAWRGINEELWPLDQCVIRRADEKLSETRGQAIRLVVETAWDESGAVRSWEEWKIVR